MLLQPPLGSTSAMACTEHPWEHNWGCHRTSATVPRHCHTLQPSLPKLQDKGTWRAVGAACSDRASGGPRAGGDGSDGHFPAAAAAAPRGSTDCAAVWESHFSHPEAEPGYRFSKPAPRNPLARASCLHCRGLPRPPPAQAATVPTLQGFRPG